MCVNNLSKVSLDSAAAGIEPATSSRKSYALTTAPSAISVVSVCLVRLARFLSSSSFYTMFLNIYNDDNGDNSDDCTLKCSPLKNRCWKG